jgi:hypothetical protein
VTRVRAVSPPDAPLFQAAVCEFHDISIDEGANWLYDPADGVIRMGTDLPAYTSASLRKGSWRDDGELVGELQVRYTSTDGDERTLDLMISPAQAAGLVDMFGHFLPKQG